MFIIKFMKIAGILHNLFVEGCHCALMPALLNTWPCGRGGPCLLRTGQNAQCHCVSSECKDCITLNAFFTAHSIHMQLMHATCNHVIGLTGTSVNSGH